VKRYRSLGIVLVLLAAFAGFELWPNDEARIRARMRELAELLPKAKSDDGRAELKAWLGAHAAPDLVVRLPESGVELSGTAEVLRFAHETLAALPSVQISLVDNEVHAEANAARASTVCGLISQGAGELRDTRRVTTSWSKRAGEFQLDVLDVDPRHRDQPEARP
jgi:hypothetical protein